MSQRTFKNYLLGFLSTIFPPVELWRANLAINEEKRINDYKGELEEIVDGFEGNFSKYIEDAEKAHGSELERSSNLDSKAGNYFGNIGVVLSILSLAPLFAVILGVNNFNQLVGSWLRLFLLLIFVYTIISLLFSSYYSHKALKMRRYKDYFTAYGVKDILEDSEENGEDRVMDLLTYTRENEINNLIKNNAISVAQSLSRNGLIGLSIFILILVIQLSF